MDELDDLPVLKKTSNGIVRVTEKENTSNSEYEAVYEKGDDLPVLKKKEETAPPASPVGGKVGASAIPSTGNETANLLGVKPIKPTQYAVPSPLVEKTKTIVEPVEKNYGLRPDGTKKDIGYFGELKTKSGYSVTEYSFGTTAVNGKEMDIPSLVPTLTPQEKQYVLDRAEKDEQLGRDAIGNSIYQKAVDHAKKRLKEGKSPFYSSAEGKPLSNKSVYEKYNRDFGLYKQYSSDLENFGKQGASTEYLTNGLLGDIGESVKNFATRVALTSLGARSKEAESRFKQSPEYKKFEGLVGKSKKEFVQSTKEADEAIKKDSEEIANLAGGWKSFVDQAGKADVDKIRESVNAKLEKEGIPTDSPIAYKLRNALKGEAEFKHIEPQVNKEFDAQYKKLYGITPEEDIQKEYGVKIEQAKGIKAAKEELEKQRLLQDKALEEEFKPEYQTLGSNYKAKSEEINAQIENDPELNSFAQQLNQEKLSQYQAMVDNGQMSVEQANAEMNSPASNEEIKQKVLQKVNEKYGKVYESAFAEYQKSLNEVASRYKSAYRQQENARVEQANKKIESEIESLKGKFQISPALIEKRKKAYSDAYAKIAESGLKAEEAAGRGLPFIAQAGMSLLMGLGGGLKGYGAEFDNKFLYDLGESLESNFKINVGESKEFSDWLDSSKLTVGTGNIIGRMIPGIGLTAAAAALTKDWNLTARLATTAVTGWGAETADMAGTIRDEVLQSTGDPAKADDAARDMWRSQLYLLPLYGLEGAPYISEFYTQLGKKIAPKIFAETAKGARKTLGQWAKETAVKTLAGGVGETITEIFQEFPQNINEEAIRNGKEIKSISDQIDVYKEGATLPKLKETIIQVAPSTLLMGGTPVFVSSAYNKAKSSYYERSVDNYLNSASISASLETSPEQYLFNINREKGNNFAGTLLNTLFTSGKISESEFDRLSEKMVNMQAYNEIVKKSKVKGSEVANLAGYRLYDQYVSANQSYESEKDELAKEVLKKQADEAKTEFIGFLQGKGANITVMRLNNGQEFAFMPDEMMFALQFPNIRESIRNGEIDVVVSGNSDKINALVKELESLEQEPQAAQQPSQPIITKNTTPTDEKYGTIDRGDGKGVVDLTRAEYEAEIAKQQPAVPATPQEAVVEEAPAFETDKTEAAQPIELSTEFAVEENTIENKRKEAESKIKRKDLFDGVGDFSTELGGSDKPAVPVSHKEINGIEFVEYAHPVTGSVDVIVTGTSDRDFVGFYRIYENGKPTNKWSSKFENQSRNKENFKTMISGVQEMLPKGHEYTEKTSISTDGLRVWNEQLNRGYELQYDENGKLITNKIAINGDAIVNELGVPVEKGSFENIKIKTEDDFKKVKEKLLPYLEKFGLGEDNIKWLSGTVKIDLPILKKTEPTIEATPSVEPSQEERKQSEIPTGNYEIAQEATRVVSEENPDASVLLTPKGEDLSLTAVFVKNEKRNKGIGTKVLESVKRQADRLGKKVVLDATTELDEETDLERLGNFYERNGFEKIGENKYQYTPKGQEEVNPALKDVESTAKALEEIDNSNLSEANKIIKTTEIIAPIIEALPNEKKLELAELTGERSNAIKKNKIAIEYAKIKAKPDATRTEQEQKLTKAVEQLLTPNTKQNEAVNENVREIGNGQENGQKGGVSQEAKSSVQEEGEKNVETEGGVTAPSTKTQPNEKVTEKENGKPLSEGVQGVRTETEERKTSPELRPNQEEVTATINNAVAKWNKLQETTKKSEQRQAAKEYREAFEKMPTVKNVFDNIKTIFAQLEKADIIKTKNCP